MIVPRDFRLFDDPLEERPLLLIQIIERIERMGQAYMAGGLTFECSLIGCGSGVSVLRVSIAFNRWLSRFVMAACCGRKFVKVF
jgi:hypothetical protein